MKWTIRLTAIAVFALNVLGGESDALVLRGATWINNTGAVVRDSLIVLRNGRVEAIGASKKLRTPHGARVIDVRGRWIVSGFVDNHVHLRWTKAEPALWTRAGITTLVENGSRVSPARLRASFHGGPRVAACGPIFTAVGGYPAFGEKDAPALEVSGAADAARKTAEFIEREHPDCIKIAIERGFLQDLDEKGWPALNAAEVGAIVKTAHEHKLGVRAHVSQEKEFALAVAAGVDVIAHSPLSPLSDDMLRYAVDRHVVIVSTVGIWADPDLRKAAVDNLVRYVRVGGAIAIGTDYPNWKTPGFPATELRLLKAAGLSNDELLGALTHDTTATRQDRADFVVLGTDPRSSLDAFTDVRMVIRNGRVVYDESKKVK